MEEDLSTIYLAAADALEVVSHLKPSFTRNAVPRLNSMSVFYSCEQLRTFREILESSASKIAIRWEFKDVRAQNFPRTDFFEILTAGRK